MLAVQRLPQVAGVRRAGSQRGIGRLERGLQIRNRGRHVSDGLSAQARGALGDVAGENDYAVAGARIIGLRVELAVRQPGHAVPQQVAKTLLS